MPAFLQFATVCAILSLESNAVLAVVVTHTPRQAFASQTGVMGVGLGVGVGVVLLLFVLSVVPPSVLVHARTTANMQLIVNESIIFLMAVKLIRIKLNKQIFQCGVDF